MKSTLCVQVQRKERNLEGGISRNACNWHRLQYYVDRRGKYFYFTGKRTSNIKFKSTSSPISMIHFHRQNIESLSICNFGFLCYRISEINSHL